MVYDMKVPKGDHPMICNIASDLSTKQLVWTVRDLSNGRYIQGLPAHKVPDALRRLQWARDDSY